jgi:RNA polymerase sigma-70 factor (ECF subfamily)
LLARANWRYTRARDARRERPVTRDEHGESEDRALVDRANRGDASAFEALYRRHRDFVVSLAWRLTGSRDDALDVLQETFARLFERFPGFALRSSLRAYLYPVVRNACISLARRRRKVVPIAASHEPADERVSASDWTPDFEALVRALPEGQQEVLRLRFVLEMRLHEIADALGLPLGTVKSRLHNALKSLGSRPGGSES